MTFAFIEVLIEPLIELAFWFVSAVVGLAVAELSYSLWVAARWVIVSDRRPVLVQDDDGVTWGVRVTWRPWPSEWPLSSRLLGLNGTAPHVASRSRQHWLNPNRLVDRFDDALIFVVPFILAFVVMLIAVFIVETVVVVFVVAVAAAWCFVSRRSWRVLLTSPDGAVEAWVGLTLEEATDLADTLTTGVVSSGSFDIGAVPNRST